MATYEINGREVSKEEYDRATAGIPNKYKSKAKPVDDVTADKSTTSNSPSCTNSTDTQASQCCPYRFL